MYVTTKHLLDDLLPRLEAQWVEQGAPIASRLRPGASEKDLDAFENRLGHPLPEEIRILWSWHDGTTEDHVHFGQCVVARGYDFLSSAQAAAMLDWRLEQNGRPYPDPEPTLWEGDWHPAWLPMFSHDAYVLFADVRQRTQGGTVPIRRHDWCPDDPFTPIAGSVAGLIGAWVQVLEQRQNYWSTSEGGWVTSEGETTAFDAMGI